MENIKKCLKKIYHKLPITQPQREKIYHIYQKVKGNSEDVFVSVYTNPLPKLAIAAPLKVSVIIPNYNYEKYIEERIDSVIFQTYPIYELIIIDDCSSDNSREVIRRKIREIGDTVPIRFIENNVNSGNVFIQWKRAFQEAKGDYIWIAEADDSCAANFLETVIKGFDDPKTVISYCESLTMDENGKLLMGDLRPWIDIFNCGKWNDDYIKDGIDEITETMCINNTIANVSSVVFKKGDYDSYIETARRFRLAGDWYVYMRILETGKVAYFKDSLNYHRMQPQGMTLSTKHEKEFEEIVWLQNYALGHYPVSEEVRKKVFERRERERKRFGL